MVAIVSGNGLGLSLTSLATLGRRGELGTAQQGRNGERAYVNIANGNLVLQDRDDVLVGRGQDIEVVRTYNSQGLLSDRAPGWTVGAAAQRLTLAGTAGAAGSSVTRTERDGAQAVYAWNAGRGLYESSAGAGAFDTVAYDAGAGQFTWTDGDSGLSERYQAGGAGRLLSSRDPHGNTVSYAYDAEGNLQKALDANGEATCFDYSARLLTQIRTVAADGTTLTRVRYAYDASQRLASVQLDLSPQDNSVADLKTYTTTYRYDGASTRIAGITQSDGTSLAFTYVQIGAVFRVASVQDGAGQLTRYTYDLASGRTSVTDPLGRVSVYSHDARGQLTAIQAPAVAGVPQTIGFSYDAGGNLTRVVDGEGRATDMVYDAAGNQVLRRDAAGQTVTRSYDARNQLLTEAVYTVADADGAGAAAPAGAQVSRYVHDSGARHLLRYAISAEGRVTEHRYDSHGQRTSTVEYAGALYGVAALGASGVPTEAQMNSWAAAQDRTRTQRTDRVYDARGQLQSETSYAAVAADGSGIADGSQGVTRYVHDRAGLLLSRIDAAGGSTLYVHDGLGRLLSSTDATGQTTLTRHDDAGNRTVVTLANGRATTSAYDQAGRLASVLHSGAQGAELGRTQYFHDAQGRLRMTQDPSGVRTHKLYDEAGRLVADIDGSGSLTEYSYDKNNQLTRTLAYADALGAAALARLVDAGGRPTALTLASLGARRNPAQDLVSWRIHDEAGRLVRTVAADGAVVDFQYDGASRLVAETRRATLVNVAGLGAVATLAQTQAAPSGEDPFAGRSTVTDPAAFAPANQYASFLGAQASPTYKGVASALGLLTDGLGIIQGVAMTAAGVALTGVPEPTTLTKWAGVPLTAYGAAYATKSVVGFGLNFKNLMTAISGVKNEASYMPGSALEWAVASSGGSNDAQRLAVAADLALGLTTGRVLDARLATGVITNSRTAALFQPSVTTSVSREATLVAPGAWGLTSRIDPYIGAADLSFKLKENMVDPWKKTGPNQR